MHRRREAYRSPLCVQDHLPGYGLVSRHVHRKAHLAVPATTESPAASVEVAGLARCEEGVAWMRLGRSLVDPQGLDQEAVRHIVGNEPQPDRLATMHRDAGWFKGKSPGMYFYHTLRPLGSRRMREKGARRSDKKEKGNP